MARNGYQIFDADTHVGPAAEILAQYLTAKEQATLTTWEPYKAVQRRTGHVTYTRGARAYRRRLGLADTDAAATSPGYRRFLQKNFPNYNAATGRIRISHLGKSGWRSKRCSTSCIAFLPNAIPF